MELIVINENKLKIIMNNKDMQFYNLDENEFYCSVTNTREILAKILHNTQVRTGFENISNNDKILMQLYPDKNGGCELYVTKITLDEKEENLFMVQENEEQYLLPKHIQKKPPPKIQPISYRFDKLEYVIQAAQEMHKRSYDGISSFYRDDYGKYFLIISNQKNDNTEHKSKIDFLSEFGEITNVENTYLALLEKGICIFKEKAIEQLLKI